MRVMVIRSDCSSNKQNTVRMMPFNTDKEKEACLKYMSERQAADIADGNLYTYHQQDIGFDIVYTNLKSELDTFMEENPEYDKYEQCIMTFKQNGQPVTGYIFYKNWEAVEKARSLKMINDALYERIALEDCKKVSIEIENLGCNDKQEFLRRIAKNIAEEIKNDTDILKCLRSGENRKKENQISFRNWIDIEGDEMSCVTYRNGGQAFSLTFDADMNLLCTKYNSKVFVKGHEWVPYEDAEEKKDCLCMIHDKMPDMEFNLWLAEMGENEIYKQLKEEFEEKAPNIGISSYYPLKELGRGYFTAEYEGLQMAVQIKDRALDGCKFRRVSPQGKGLSHWESECPDQNNPLFSLMSQLKYTGHILDDGMDASRSRFKILFYMLKQMNHGYKMLTEENRDGMNTMGINDDLDKLIVKFKDINDSITLQSVIKMPIEYDGNDDGGNTGNTGEKNNENNSNDEHDNR